MSHSVNLVLYDLQKIILGKRTELLSNIEISNLFSNPSTPESNLHLLTALNRRKIDPNTTLIQAIANSKKETDLVPISLALRYGADPNLYLEVPNIGEIHILGYTYLALSDRSLGLLNSVVIMLTEMGSDGMQAVFKPRKKLIKDDYSLVEPIEGRSVIEWLDEQGYNHILCQIKDRNYEKVDPDFLTLLATYLDSEDMLGKGKPSLERMISSFSVKLLNKYSDEYDLNKGLRLSIKHLNLDAFEKFIQNGCYVYYVDINVLIGQIKLYQEQGDFISMCQIREMLIISIEYGSILDKYQEETIKNIDERTYNKILCAYENPYWLKACKSDKGIADDKLKLLSYRLNLYPDAPKGTLCDQIKNITRADPVLIKKSVLIRQACRIKADAACICDFKEGEIPDIKFSNRSMISKNIYDYPDVDISYYRDFQGSLWCFGSNNYTKMIEKGINPYTGQDFPEYYISEVEKKASFISTYRPLDEVPVPISKTIDSLSELDTIDNYFTDKAIDEIKDMMEDKQISEVTINKMDNRQIENKLNKLFNDNINLTMINDNDDLERTFLVTSYQLIKQNPDNYNKFFDIINDVDNK